MNILFITFIHQGHLNPSIYVIEKAVSLGNKIVCYTMKDFQNRFSHLPITLKLIPYKNIYNKEDSEKYGKIAHIMEACKGYHIPIINALSEDKTKYDMVICDSFMDACGFAKALNIPKAMQIYTLSPLLKDDDLETVKEKYSEFLKKYYEESGGVISENVHKGKFFLRFFFNNHIHNEAQYKLVCTSPLLISGYEKLDDTFYFIGPTGVKRNLKNSGAAFDFNFEEVKSKKEKLVFISFGTLALNIEPEKRQCLINILKAVDGIEGIKIIFTLSQEGAKTELPPFSNKMNVYEYVPQLKVLEHCDLCITHGGFNTTNESLYNAVPLLIIPQMFDQYENAEAVEELKCGIYLKAEDVTEKTVIESVQKILTEPIYKQKAEEVSKSMKDYLNKGENLLEKIFTK